MPKKFGNASRITTATAAAFRFFFFIFFILTHVFPPFVLETGNSSSRHNQRGSGERSLIPPRLLNKKPLSLFSRPKELRHLSELKDGGKPLTDLRRNMLTLHSHLWLSRRRENTGKGG